MTSHFGYGAASDSKPRSNEFKAEGEFLDPCSLAIKGLAPKASNCYFCPSLLWPGHWGSFLRSTLLPPALPSRSTSGSSWFWKLVQPCSSLSWSYPVLISGFQGLHVYLLFSRLGSIGETAWHLVSLQKHGKREWLNETILVEGG